MRKKRWKMLPWRLSIFHSVMFSLGFQDRVGVVTVPTAVALTGDGHRLPTTNNHNYIGGAGVVAAFFFLLFLAAAFLLRFLGAFFLRFFLPPFLARLAAFLRFFAMNITSFLSEMLAEQVPLSKVF